MSKKTKIFLIITGALPILGIFSWPPDTMLLIYTFFVAILLFREKITNTISNIKCPVSWKFFFIMIANGLVAETLAWTSNYLAKEPAPALLHPQLIPDLILGIGFYGGWAIAWLIVLRFWRFSVLSIFITNGLSGIWTEQGGIFFFGFIQNLFSNPLGAIYGSLYIFLVYGSIAGIAYLPIAHQLNQKEYSNKFVKYLKYPIAWILLFFIAQITTGLVLTLANFFKLIPEAKPIWEYPFF